MILHYHNAMSEVKCIIMRMRMWVHITLVNWWLIYYVPEFYEYIKYTMVSLYINLLLSGESMHGPARFYSKLTVSYIKPTHRNDETEVLLTFSEFKELHSFHSAESFRPCILWLPTRYSITANVPNVFQYVIFIHSRWISWQADNRANFFFGSLILPGLFQEFCRIIIFQSV